MNLTPINHIVVPVLFLLVFSSAISADSMLIDFKEIDRSEAGLAGKKIMVSFTADWCLPCKIIESSLYNDPEIADLVNNNFQPVMVDIDSFFGESWSEEYNVHYLPSIIFTNSRGIEFERTKGTPSRSEFLDLLRKIINTDSVPYRAHNHTATEVVYTGQDIQLGAFSRVTSAQRRIQDLNAFIENNYIVIQEETKGKILYKVVQQGLLSKEESIKQLKLYHQNGFEAFLRPD